MFIEPMQAVDSIGGIGQLTGTGGLTGAKNTDESSGDNMFLSIFQDSIANVRETEAAVVADNLALATGDVDDLHSLGINQAKAQLSVSVLVQLRNGFLDAYNELMRISL